MITKTRIECIANCAEWIQCIASGLRNVDLNPIRIQFLTDAQMRELESALNASKHHLHNAMEIFAIVRDNAEHETRPRVIPCNPNND